MMCFIQRRVCLVMRLRSSDSRFFKRVPVLLQSVVVRRGNSREIDVGRMAGWDEERRLDVYDVLWMMDRGLYHPCFCA